MYKYVLIGAAGLLLAACATTSEGDSMASAPQPEPARVANNANENTSAEAEEYDQDEEICRRVQQTGTRFHSTVCQTRGEWERQAEEARQSTSDVQRSVEPNCAVTGSC